MGAGIGTRVVTARAKVNLTLHVLGRRADGYHELESLVAFADIGDVLAFTPGGALSLEIVGPFADVCGSLADNLVLKAAAALAAQLDDARLELGRFVLTKNLPVAAGLGGGSADAAAALWLLAVTNGLPADDPRLRVAAAMVGADVPVCLASRARVMRGIGHELGPADFRLDALPAVLVNPGVALATKDVFASLQVRQAERAAIGDIPQRREDLISWLSEHGNDLEAPAVTLQPVIADVLKALRACPNCKLARMSGSGATCFALFASDDDAQQAAALLRKKQPTWWVTATTLG